MNGVASGVLRGMRADLREHGVIPLLELESELPTVLGHKGQLQEVVFNLLRNALDAMKVDPSAKRTLRVCTGKRGSNAIGISVQDTGPGIAPGQMERIFDPFVTTKKDGMGMGLAICRMIIERHGGQLSASSDIGTGARFEIILPIEPAPESDRESAKEVVVTTDTQRFFRRQRRTKDPLATGNAVV
jgi:signal transduction histidine kinase